MGPWRLSRNLIATTTVFHKHTAPFGHGDQLWMPSLPCSKRQTLEAAWTNAARWVGQELTEICTKDCGIPGSVQLKASDSLKDFLNYDFLKERVTCHQTGNVGSSPLFRKHEPISWYVQGVWKCVVDIKPLNSSTSLLFSKHITANLLLSLKQPLRQATVVFLIWVEDFY